MYTRDTSATYTFVSCPAKSTHLEDNLHYNHHHHQQKQRQDRRRSKTTSDRCNVHPAVAQLYLRTISSLDGLPRRSYSDTLVVEKKGSRKADKMSSLNGVATASACSSSTTTAMEAGDAKLTSTFNPAASFVHSQIEAFPALSSTDASSSTGSSSSAWSKRLTSTQMRALLASSMSSMYRSEVPLYGDLLSIIGTVNSDVIRASPPDTISDDEISRLNVERHGAIRVGTAQELSLLARIFKVFGMHPVGYYDLWRDAKLPIHATAFRAVDKEQLVKNPFRIFCSLLRMDCIPDAETRSLAKELLSKRKIVSDRCIELLVKAEAALKAGEEDDVKVDGLTRQEALEFVERVVDIFAWHKDTPVSLDQYSLLAKTHPLVADIVSFRGPHINHLTPRTLDIDQVQRTMIASGIDAKDVIEGPPRRHNEVYLRQTSFHALSESVEFLGGKGETVEGKHKARFGEIEARGQALTRKGAKLYDELMKKVAVVKRQTEEKRGEKVDKEECVRILQEVFEDGFPDSKDALLRQGLGYFTFSVKNHELAKAMWQQQQDKDESEALADMVQSGALDAAPITYEDFLPASAAGIFQSNLPQTTASQPRGKTEEAIKSIQMDETEARQHLEAAVGGTVLDYFGLYSEQQRQSLVEAAASLGIASA